jgi:hypothetical protein
MFIVDFVFIMLTNSVGVACLILQLYSFRVKIVVIARRFSAEAIF